MILVIIILLSDDTFHLSSVAHFQAQTHLHTCHIWVCLCFLLQTTADSTDTHGNLAVLILHCSSHKSAIVHCCWQKSRKRTRRTLKNSLTVCHSQCVRVCVCVKVIKQHKKTSEQKLNDSPPEQLFTLPFSRFLSSSKQKSGRCPWDVEPNSQLVSLQPST